MLLVAASLIYVAGMYLNDAVDRDYVAVERPSRPIPSGQAGVTEVFVIGFALLAAGLLDAAVVASISPTASVAGAVSSASALAACVVAYDFIHKRTPAAVLLMAACRTLVYCFAAYATAPHASGALAAGMAALFAYVCGLTAVARQETQSGISSPWPLALLGRAFVVALWLGFDEPAGIAFALIFALWVFEAVRPLTRARSDVPLAVSRMIAGICLLDAAFIGSRGYVWGAVLAALGTVLTRVLQRRVPGT
jgi:4-hydroxybenzoate polyprenyltransferase